MLSAFHEVVTGRAPDMLRAYLLAVVIQMVAVNLLGHYGYLQTTIQPFLAWSRLRVVSFSAWV